MQNLSKHSTSSESDASLERQLREKDAEITFFKSTNQGLLQQSKANVNTTFNQAGVYWRPRISIRGYVRPSICPSVDL